MSFWLYVFLGILFVVVVPALYVQRRKLAEVYFPLVLWRVKKGKSIFDKIAAWHPGFWRSIGELGMIFAFGCLGVYYLLKNQISFRRTALYFFIFVLSAVFFALIPMVLEGIVPPLFTNIFIFLIMVVSGYGLFTLSTLIYYAGFILVEFVQGNTEVAPGVAPLIPGVKIPGLNFYLPLYTIISIAIILIIHEGFHGIVARVERFKLKSYGVLSLGLLPIGGFVEPDESQVLRANSLKRVRLYSAGSMGNFIGAFIFLGLFVLFSSLFSGYILEQQREHFLGYRVLEVFNTSPLRGIVEPNDIIYNYDLLFNRTAYQIVTLHTNKGEITAQRNEQGLLGILVSPEYSEFGADYYLITGFLDILRWTYLLNLILGMVNYLPFAIMDGSRLFEEIIRPYFKHRTQWFSRALSYVILSLLLINALPLFF